MYLHVIFQTCWACVFTVPTPWVKDTEACLCEEEAIFSASSETSFFLLPSLKQCLFFVDVDCQKHRRASFFWDLCKLLLENIYFRCLLRVYFTFQCNNSIRVHILYKPLMSLFYCRTQTNFVVKNTVACLCEEEAIFSASSEERERQLKASKL